VRCARNYSAETVLRVDARDRPAVNRATARALSPDTAASSLGAELGLGPVDEEELYRALDWLAVRQPAIETALGRRHLAGGTLVLYDVTSSYMEGRCCPLAQFGYNRDGKKGKLQIVYGLLCAPDGCPVAVEVFEGATALVAWLGGDASVDRAAEARLVALCLHDAAASSRRRPSE